MWASRVSPQCHGRVFSQPIRRSVASQHLASRLFLLHHAEPYCGACATTISLSVSVAALVSLSLSVCRRGVHPGVWRRQCAASPAAPARTRGRPWWWRMMDQPGVDDQSKPCVRSTSPGQAQGGRRLRAWGARGRLRAWGHSYTTNDVSYKVTLYTRVDEAYASYRRNQSTQTH